MLKIITIALLLSGVTVSADAHRHRIHVTPVAVPVAPIVLPPIVTPAAGHGSATPVPPNCPNGNTFSDGCAGAPASGVIKHSTFFTGYANQSSQTYTTRPPWNAAGVEYGVGYPTGQSFKDPAVDTGSLPSGCSYISATHRVSCNGSVSPQFIGWDFGGGSTGCVRLEFQSNVSGNVLIQNSNFLASTQCGTNNLISFNSFNTALTSATIIDNVIDGNGQNTGNGPANLVSFNTQSASLTFEYNACLHVIARCVNGGGGGTFLYAFNYSEGFTYLAPVGLTGSISAGTLTVTAINSGPSTLGLGYSLAGTSIPANVSITALGTGTGGTGTYTVSNAGITIGSEAITASQALHGELAEMGSGGLTSPLQSFSYNTILNPTTAVGQEVTSLIYASAGAVGATWTTTNVDHNTLVANAGVGPSFLAVAAYDTYTTLNWTQNYMDPTGGSGCFSHQSSPSIGTENFSGNLNMITNSAVNATGAC